MKCLIDMNISPVWEDYLLKHGIDATQLAATNAMAPSVIQIRAQDLTTEAIGEQLLRCLNQFKAELEVGCILTLDTKKAKVRLLPLNPL